MNRNYRKFQTGFAREHRNNSTKAEVRLWCELLRKKQFHGLIFRRQVPIGPYIYDFYCAAMDLVIEVDGYTHDAFEETRLNDAKKDQYASERGLNIIRFTDDEVKDQINYVKQILEGIYQEKLKEN
ncbi:MAG: DUF559 domain-containing protein [Chitinophagales bacterium]|mgnify:CR=1 FL=1|nr:DUF559 domain-containing protein [Chitinophagales bacterium]